MKFGTLHTTVIIFICLSFQSSYSQDSLDFDMDAMWDNTIWTEIEEATYEDHEVDKITAVAGVRGAEAEDEALEHLYYRRSMKKLSKLDLQRALGKLILKKEKMLEKNLDISKIDNYIIQVKNKLKTV